MTVALHTAANPEKHPRLQLMLADLSEVMKCCEEKGEQREQLIIYLRVEQGTGEQLIRARYVMAGKLRF